MKIREAVKSCVREAGFVFNKDGEFTENNLKEAISKLNLIGIAVVEVPCNMRCENGHRYEKGSYVFLDRGHYICVVCGRNMRGA